MESRTRTSGIAIDRYYLYFYDTPAINGLYSPCSGVLLIKGKDSLAAYQEALRKQGGVPRLGVLLPHVPGGGTHLANRIKIKREPLLFVE